MYKPSPVFSFVATLLCGFLGFAVLSRIGSYFTSPLPLEKIPLWLANGIAGIAIIVGLVRIVELFYYVWLPKISGRINAK